jgi:uncharacterized protein (TIGR03118 family)
LFLTGLCAATQAIAQANNFKQINLVSSVPGLALRVDPGLVDPWGIAASFGQPFRIANHASGTFRSYDSSGAPQVFAGNIALPAGSVLPSNPTGVVANPTALFVPHGSLASPYLFATEDGTISGEYADDRRNILQTTILAIDNSSRGSRYTGLSLLSPDCCAPFLAVADFRAGVIDTFTGGFSPLQPSGDFVDPYLPSGYAPYNLAVIGGQVFVAYAEKDPAGTAPMTGPGKGLVNIFDLEGNFVRRFLSSGVLNAPWGLAKASANFGAFSNDILVGNSGDGTINAFDPERGAFLGALRDGNGNVIVNSDLHGLTFGNGTAGEAETLYFTAGLVGGLSGLFGSISVNASGAGPDFSLTASPSSATLVTGQSASFELTAVPKADFRGIVAFSCEAPPGIECTIGKPSLNPGTGAASVLVTAAISASNAMTHLASVGFRCLLLIGFGQWMPIVRRRKRLFNSPATSLFLAVATVMTFFGLLGMTGCGSKTQTLSSGRTASIVVTANSGSISRSTTLLLNVQ